jgi:hypothetical protein
MSGPQRWGGGFVLAGVVLVIALAGGLAVVALSLATASVRSGRAWSESVRAEVHAWSVPDPVERVLGDSLVMVETVGSDARARWPVLLLLVRGRDSSGAAVVRPVARHSRARGGL